VLQTASPDVFFRMEKKGDAFYQTSSEQGKTHSERFDLVLGSGRRGQSYLYWKNGLLYQLPVSYLALTGGWVNSPGYPDGEVHFDRQIPLRCLECHATEGARAGQFLAGITCGKCHGPAAQHPAIRNPAKRDRDGQVSLCAACHSGLGNGAEADVHGNQVGLLRQSNCFRNSPQMTCSTCHNIHRVERDLVAMSARCASCHASGTCPHAAEATNCIDCHMPVQESKVITFRSGGQQFAQTYRTHKIAVYAAPAPKLQAEAARALRGGVSQFAQALKALSGNNQDGYPLDSSNRSGSGLVGRSPWTARDAHVPLAEAEAGAFARARAPAPQGAANCANRSQADTHHCQFNLGQPHGDSKTAAKPQAAAALTQLTGVAAAAGRAFQRRKPHEAAQAPKPQAAAARVQFIDVAAEAEIAFRHENGASP